MSNFSQMMGNRSEAQRIYEQRKKIKWLEKKLEQKENIIKEVREYIKERTEFGEYTYAYPGILNQDEVREINRILDKEVN